VWGSKFTTKAATLHGDSADFAARSKVKFWICVVVAGGGAALLSRTADYNLEEPSKACFASAAKAFLHDLGYSSKSVRTRNSHHHTWLMS